MLYNNFTNFHFTFKFYVNKDEKHNIIQMYVTVIILIAKSCNKNVVISVLR